MSDPVGNPEARFSRAEARDVTDSLNHDDPTDVIDASRYLDDFLNIDYPYFEGMADQIYPPDVQLNKTNTTDTEAPFLD